MESFGCVQKILKAALADIKFVNTEMITYSKTSRLKLTSGNNNTN